MGRSRRRNGRMRFVVATLVVLCLVVWRHFARTVDSEAVLGPLLRSITWSGDHQYLSGPWIFCVFSSFSTLLTRKMLPVRTTSGSSHLHQPTDCLDWLAHGRVDGESCKLLDAKASIRSSPEREYICPVFDRRYLRGLTGAYQIV